MASEAEKCKSGKKQEREARRGRACQLRESGRSLDDIAAEMGISRSTAFHWTRHLGGGSMTPARERRREREEQARQLRAEGMPYKEIARELGVAVSTAYSWSHRVRVPASAARRGRSPEELREMNRRRWEPELRRRQQERQQAKLDAARGVGDLPDGMLPVLAALAYWCEGGKDKPWQRRELLQFVNSDPVLLRLFLLWLRSEGVGPDRLRLRVAIHETADVSAAERWWAEQLGVSSERFERATLKRHSPRTNRKNRSAGYHGCLVVSVVGSRELYWRMEGLFVGAADRIGALSPPTPGRSLTGSSRSAVV